MSGNITPHTPAGPSIRGAAEALIGQIDRAADLMPIVAEITQASELLREALAQPEVSRADLLERGPWAVEGIAKMKAGEPVLPIHIKAIVEAAEAGLQAAGSFGLRWAADMRAIDRWRAAAPQGEDRSLILPDHADLVVWLLGLFDRSAEVVSLDAVEQLAERLGRAGMWHASQGSAHGDSIVGGDVAELIRKIARIAIAADHRAFLAEQRAIPDDLEAQIAEHLGAELGDSYDCTRVWEAWNVGTMSEDDFEPLSERLDDLAAGLAARIAPFSILGLEPAEASGSGQERIAGSDGPLIINLNRDTEGPIEIINGKSSGPVPGVYSEDQASIARVRERLELEIANAKPGAWPFPPGRDVMVKLGEDTYIGRVQADGAIRFEEE